MALVMILTQLLLLLHLKNTESAKSTIALPSCPESCGGIPIPYPIGIGLNCSLSRYFNVTCDLTYNNSTPTPYLFFGLPIMNISIFLGQARVGSLISYQCYNTTTKEEDTNYLGFFFGERSRFWVNTEKNKVTVIGCNTLAYLGPELTSDYAVGCFSSCDTPDTLYKYGSCSGIGCCQTDISKETNLLIAFFDDRYNNLNVYNFSPYSYAMIVEEAKFKFHTTYITTDFQSLGPSTQNSFASTSLPMLLSWAIGNTTCDIVQKNKSSYTCNSDHSVCLKSFSAHGGYLYNCSYSYEGNPYID